MQKLNLQNVIGPISNYEKVNLLDHLTNNRSSHINMCMF